MRMMTMRILFTGAIAAYGSMMAFAGSYSETTARPPALAELYPDARYSGQPVALAEPGFYPVKRLDDLGLPASSLSSVRLASGYQLRLYHEDKEDDLLFWVCGEDMPNLAELDIDDAIASVKVEPAPQGPRPRVFLALHGNKPLGDDAVAEQWRYVRENCEGIWYNAAGLKDEEIAPIIRKLTTRNVVCERDIGKGLGQLESLRPNVLQSAFPDIRFQREAVAMWRQSKNKDETNWKPEDILDARSIFIEGKEAGESNAWMRFSRVYAGTLGGIHGDSEPQAKVFPLADGTWTERAGFGQTFNRAGREDFMNLVRNARIGDRPFLLFMGVGETWRTDPEAAMRRLKSNYFWMEAVVNWRPGDGVTVINYSGRAPQAPETDSKGQPAATYTGMLYWLLHQGDKD
ncbi:MAG: hypothetical protein NTW86_02040 [Candidatus Sumerlaeota bacterium]|nr:hypothetical protein [Candidatus Sumerlaeota bacterium]